jgi:NADH-quinone oxidoreductase chain G
MLKIKINNSEFLVKNDISVLEACKYVGISVPRFCYHETLSIAGNCRMCLVEIEKTPKPVSSCTLPVSNNMQIYTDTPLVKKARENVIETLLLNHPLDCPICDQGGECDLQDQTQMWGSDYSRFFMTKRGVEDKNCGPLIKTIMTRCIHCTRCVRFGSEIAGVDFLGTLNRGTSTEIGGYVSRMFNSEISGNVIDLCPVGALTSKPYAFKARPWELRSNESVDLTDSTGSNIYVNFKESEVLRILPKNNSEINENLISDKARFSHDSLKTQRLQKLFGKTDDSKYHSLDWSVFFEKIDILLSSDNKRKITFLVNEELDVQSLCILKSISNKHPSFVSLKSVSRVDKNKNYFVNWTNNKINDVKSTKTCFLFSSNIRLESAILNSKIRNKVVSENFNVLSFGQKFNSNFSVKFVNLNVSNLLKILEAKSVISKLIISSESPLFCFGESFNKRFSGSFSLTSFLKKLNPSSVLIDIKGACNTESFNFLRVETLNSNAIATSDIFIAVNLEDTVVVRKYLLNSNKPLIWINTHGSKLASRANFIVPTGTFFEQEGLFLNLEQRPQKTLKSISCIEDSRPLKNILMSFYPTITSVSMNKNVKFLSFLNEIVEQSNLFKSLKNKLSDSDVLETKFLMPSNSVSLHSFKSTIEDFYRSNSLSKNSITMSKCSQEYRNNNNNFKTND